MYIFIATINKICSNIIYINVIPTLKKQLPPKAYKSSNGYPFKASLPEIYNSRNLTPSEISELEKREYLRLEKLPLNERERIKHNRAKRQAEKEESLAKLRVYNEEQISNEQAKRRMDMEARAALQQRAKSLRKRREEKMYEALMKGNTRRNINPEIFKAFAHEKRKKGTRKKISDKRFEVIKENRNKSMFPQFPVPMEQLPVHMEQSPVDIEESPVDMEESRFPMELADEEENKGGSISKSKTAKKRKNKRKTMRR